MVFVMISIATFTSALPPPNSDNNCPANCSCVAPTITCYGGTIPHQLPENIVEVELLDLYSLDAREFCNVTWDNVRKLSIMSYEHELILEYYDTLISSNNYFYDYDHVFARYDHAFDCLGQIETLKLRDAQFWTPADNTFTGLTNLTVLDLSGSNIQTTQFTGTFSVRNNLPKLALLNISSTSSETVVRLDQPLIDALSSRPLHTLDLSHNEVTFDFINSIELCETLSTLNLQDSFLLVENLPEKCGALQLVDLSGTLNFVEYFKQACIRNNYFILPIHSFISVKVIYLDRIITESIDYDILDCDVLFSYPKNIRELYFSHNCIPVFEFLFNFSNGYLEYINLSHNEIKSINVNAFIGLPDLTKIDLSYNKFNEMQNLKGTFADLFRRNANLVSIDLSSNGLSYIPGKTFFLNSNLKEINLSRNNFKQLSLNLSLLYDLRILDLRFNKIKYLDKESQDETETLFKKRTDGRTWSKTNETLKVILEGNPFNCDCEALSFLQWFVTSPVFNMSYICQLDGEDYSMTRAIVEVAEEDCERPKRKRRILLLSTILPGCSVSVFITLLVFLYKRHKRKLKQHILDVRRRQIQEDNTGFKFTLFLSYSSLDADFVVEHVRLPLQVCVLLNFNQCHAQ